MASGNDIAKATDAIERLLVADHRDTVHEAGFAAIVFADGFRAGGNCPAIYLQVPPNPKAGCEEYQMDNYQPICDNPTLNSWIEERVPKAFDEPTKRAVQGAVKALALAANLKIGESWHDILVPLETIIIALLEVPELAL
jgi:hypothetical protein